MFYGRICLKGDFLTIFWGGLGMGLLGSRLRRRRQNMQQRLSDVAGLGSVSFLSKVENGVAQPSLGTLNKWSERLQTTVGELLGDHLILDAAKQSILLTEKCHSYLDYLQPSAEVRFLGELSASATRLSMPVPDPPDDRELEYITAVVLRHRGMFQEARVLSEKVLTHAYAPLLRMRCLSLLCLIYGELAEPDSKKKCEEDLRRALLELDYNTLLHCLPDADALSTPHLGLLLLGEVAESLNQL